MLKLFKNKVAKHEPAYTRKQRSENRLAELRISYNPNLPETIEDNTSKIRTSSEIASKIVSLWEIVNIANKVKKSSRRESIAFLKDVKLWSSLSRKEQDFLSRPNPNKQQIIDLSWRTEVLKVLYWALNEISILGDPLEDLSLIELSEKLIEKYPTIESFINNTQLRPKNEILDEADFTYRLHWSARSHRRKKQGVPSKYNYSVIVERDFAFRWITNPQSEWDEITLDT